MSWRRGKNPVESWVMSGAFSRRLDASAVCLSLAAIAGLVASAKADENPAGHERPWSFAPLAEHVPPQSETAGWAQTRIDGFLLADMTAAGLEPASPADDRMLVRRLYFDLVGLPPTSDAVHCGLGIEQPTSAVLIGCSSLRARSISPACS